MKERLPERTFVDANLPQHRQRTTQGAPKRATAIAYWLGTLRYIPTPQEIRMRLDCSRANAYRWHRFAAAAAQQAPETVP